MRTLRARMEFILEALSDVAKKKASSMEKFRLSHAKAMRQDAMRAARQFKKQEQPALVRIYVKKAKKHSERVRELSQKLRTKHAG